MKISLFIVAGCLIFFACTNNNSIANKNDSAKNEQMLLVQSMQRQLQQSPDSAGLRLQYAIILDSVAMYKEALMQMDTLVKKDSTNYGLLFAQGQIAEDAQDTLLALKSYSRAAHL